MLTDDQAAALRALADRLIPPDDFPGATEAGAVDYLLGQLARDLRDQAVRYAAALDSLDAEARAAAGAPFAALATETQDELLRRLSHGEAAAAWPVDPAAFIAQAAEHIAEGYYSDPGNGGNRGGVAWRMVGFVVRG